MKKLLFSLLIIATASTTQANQEFNFKKSLLKPHVSIVKMPHADGDFSYENRYTFRVCNGAGECQTIGSEIGYTKQQLTDTYGRLQQAGGIAMGIAATAIVLYTGGSGAVIGWQTGAMGSIGGAAVGGAVGVAVPVGAMDFFDSISPIQVFRQGGAKADMENGVLELVKTAQPAMIIYESLHLKNALQVAETISKVLAKKGDILQE